MRVPAHNSRVGRRVLNLVLRALLSALKANLRADIPLIELDCNVNDHPFAKACAETLLEAMGGVVGSG